MQSGCHILLLVQECADTIADEFIVPMSDLRLQPTLSNDLVRLRPLQEQDWEPLYAVASDPLIWEQHPVKTRSQRAGFEQFFQASLASKGALVAIDQQTQTVIGSSRFKLTANPKAIEIGWSFLGRAYWGGQYNKAIKGLMIQHALQYWSTVVFFIANDNLRSQRAVEKIGGRRLHDPVSEQLSPANVEDFVYIITNWQEE